MCIRDRVDNQVADIAASIDDAMKEENDSTPGLVCTDEIKVSTSELQTDTITENVDLPAGLNESTADSNLDVSEKITVPDTPPQTSTSENTVKVENNTDELQNENAVESEMNGNSNELENNIGKKEVVLNNGCTADALQDDKLLVDTDNDNNGNENLCVEESIGTKESNASVLHMDPHEKTPPETSTQLQHDPSENVPGVTKIIDDSTDIGSEIVNKETVAAIRMETDVSEEIGAGEPMESTKSIEDEDINQEQEEELLDIPTFLRRQAN